jgi:hypothetical protein
MTKFIRPALFAIASIAAALSLSACGPSPSSTAYVAPAPQVVAAAPASPYIVDPSVGCPVASYDFRNVFSGAYGVDDLRRPVNAFGFAVDGNGQCYGPAPVANIYHAAPAPLYISQLQVLYPMYYPRSYVWVAPVYIASPRLHIVTTVPTGRAPVYVNTYRAPAAAVTVPAGAAVTVRPGAPAATTTTGPAATVRPSAAAPVAAPVAPARAPVAAPAPAPAPARIAPRSYTAPATAPTRSSPFKR